MARGGLRNLLDDIALAIAPGTAGNGVFGGLGGPEAESVVMLGGEDDFAHAGIGKRAGNRVGVELYRVEEGRRFVAVTPFLVCEGVDGEMQEAGELQVMPGELTCARNGTPGCGRH